MRNIFLVGARASGKTSLGRLVARRLKAEFIDTDERLTEKLGCPISRMVARDGWETFRRLESEILKEAAQGQGRVISTGGGLVLAEENRLLMRQRGLVLYLCVPAEVLTQRLVADPKSDQRPSLTGRTPAEEVRAVLAEREPLYRQAAHHVIAAHEPLERVAEAVCLLAADQSPPPPSASPSKRLKSDS